MSTLLATVPARNLLLLALLLAGLALPASAQDIEWQEGPGVGKLGDIAQVVIPYGYRLTGADGARTLLEMLENPTDGSELGILIPPANEDGVDWFITFEFNDIGYVKDEEGESLDAEAILESIREGTEAANRIREDRGWTPIHVVGWETQPFYDSESNNLSWAIRGRSDGEDSVNYSTRLLGRRGVIHADLVVGPESLRTALPVYKGLIADCTFRPGQKYAEFQAGDTIAKYGLAALVAGGAGALAVKTGLLARMWKLLVGIGVAAAAGLRKLFGRGRRADSPGAQA